MQVTKEAYKGWRFTFCENRSQKGGQIKCLSDVLGALPNEYREKIEAARERLRDGDSAIKNTLPIWFPGGIYLESHGKENRIFSNNLICIDIDAKDNPGKVVDDFRKLGYHCPYVAAYSVSCGGAGVFMLIPLPDDSTDEARFKGYFRAIERYFRNYGYIIDKSCSNSNRARYLSFDPGARIKDLAIVWEDCDLEENFVASDPPAPDIAVLADLPSCYMEVAAIVQECERRGDPLAWTRRGWFGLACALTKILGESGRPFFLRLSKIWERRTNRRQEDDPDQVYTNALRPIGGNRATRGKFFKIAERRGIRVSGHRRFVKW